jgi:serine protease Do
MNRVKQYGPGLVVLMAAIAVLVGGPAAVRRVAFASTSAQIVQASSRLQANSLLEEINQATRDIALMVEPSVVHISTEGRRRDGRGNVEFVGSTGSGWIYDENGHIVTNAHVVEFADRIQVQMHTGALRLATLVGVDLRSDIAVIKIAPGLIHTAQRSDMPLRQGDMVFAFGSPFDFRFSMSSGIVSGLGRSAGLEDITYQNFIQVDAAINPGNSGGPLTDIRGHVVGMNTAIATGSGTTTGRGQSAGIGLAIPVGMVEAVVSQLIAKGEVERGFLGVQLVELDVRRGGSARSRGYEGLGVEIERVEPDSPASEAGIRSGDVVYEVDGEPVGASGQIMSIIASRSPGDSIRLSIWRVESSDRPPVTREIAVTLGRLAPDRVAPGAAGALRQLGLGDLATATETLARSLQVPFRRGVMIRTVEPNVAESIPPGSVITAVMEQPIATLDEFYTRLGRIFVPMIQFGVTEPAPSITIVTPDGREMQQELAVPATRRR